MEYVLGMVAAALLGTSFVLQQGAAQQVPAGDFLRLRLVADLLRKTRWLAGIGTMILGQLLSAWVLGHLILAVSEPLLATNLLVALGLTWPLSRQTLKASEIIGAAVLLAGVIALSAAQSISAVHDTIGSPGNWPYCGTAIAVLAAGLAVTARRHRGRARAVLAGTGAGSLSVSRTRSRGGRSRPPAAFTRSPRCWLAGPSTVWSWPAWPGCG